ncbi:sugar-binding domain-containing protein [Thermoflavifilum thermophilum]|uniref:Beta-galactosidase n=1 Tax=Thermoflavifilum thermophilum TaxID=1393122 RepID=A0A1I7NIR9_9BACT|nr:sugar-binding domain-containing protein [Thermoflavifilum thermophilum]SFV34561.1 beta-galactosidase [Thermoflavifilum thermophilum]
MQKIIVYGIIWFTLMCKDGISQRVKFNFNPGWKVYVGNDSSAWKPDYNDNDWKQVTVPYAWNEDDAFRKDIHDLPTGIAWYRKHFKIPVQYAGEKVFLEFEGIRQAGEFYLNGKWIGRHENGVMAFGFDITDIVHFGDTMNVLAVRIDNDWDYKEKSTHTKFQWEDRNFYANYGGIVKNVYLHIVPKVYQTLPLYSNLHTTGVYIYADNFDIPKQTATIHAESEIKNETNQIKHLVYHVSIIDINGKIVKSFLGDTVTIQPGESKLVRAASRVNGLHFWSWGYGYLYDVKTCLIENGKIIDSVTTRTGFRKTAFQNGMVYLNDRVIMIHGYAQRSTNEWSAIGSCVPAWLSDYSNGLMLEGNANLVRWMHVTPWKQDIESLDRLGIMEAMPAGDAEADAHGIQWEQRKELMRDAIIYNRNNPSIIFYECGNHGISEQHMEEMKNIRDQYDPYGGRAIGAREMLNSKIAEYGGEMLYVNKSAEKPLWAMEYMRDEGSRKYWDDYTPPYHKDGEGPLYKGQDASAYNRNMESFAIESVKRWDDFWTQRPGTGKRVSSGGAKIVFSDTNTHHRGAENYRTSGVVDALRIKKQAFFANQVMWDGWVNPEHPRMHIIGHWNYTIGVKKNIYVVSNVDQVELRINGHSIGYGEKSYDFLFTFSNVPFQPGELIALGYDMHHHIVCSDTLQTSGAPYAIRLTPIPRPTPFVADGHDLALVQVEVVDSNGHLCPTAMNMIHYSIEGPAEWRGGIAIGPDNYILSKDFPVEGGVNRFLIRSTTQPGQITIHATSQGLRPATLVLYTQPFPVENGLSRILPSEGLPCHLEKGPTPLSTSYTIKRISIPIQYAIAGANQEQTHASYDDDETTAWTNDGKLSTAWIEYTLARPATINEIVIKLNHFRTKIYNLRITIDGQLAFEGNTKATLGYYTISCNPITGSKVKIELIQPPSQDSAQISPEISGNKLGDSINDDTNKHASLGIIEIEFYEKTKNNQP